MIEPFDASLDGRERFILARLGQENRFGRSDIDAWLDREAEAITPDCDHSPNAPDKMCLWCRASRQQIIVLDDMRAALEILVASSSVVDLRAHTPRMCSWERHTSILSSGDALVRHHVGRDRFVIRVRKHRCFIIHMDGDVQGADRDTLWRPFGIDAVQTACAYADILLGEWARQGQYAVAARAVLVAAVRDTVRRERVAAASDFDAEASCS